MLAPASGPMDMSEANAAFFLSLSPLERQEASALGIPFFSCLFQDKLLFPTRPDHRGKGGIFRVMGKRSPWATSARPGAFSPE